MKYLASAIVAVALTQCAVADDLGVKVALALQRAAANPSQPCGCAVTGVCPCKPGECRCGAGCPQRCSELHQVAKADPAEHGGFCRSYSEARDHAIRDSRRLVVWVGGVCGPCVKKLSDYLHVKIAKWGDCTDGAVLIEGRDGEAWLLKQWCDRYPSPEEVDAVRLRRENGRLVIESDSVSVSSGSVCANGSCGIPSGGVIVGGPIFGGCSSGACGLPSYGVPVFGGGCASGSCGVSYGAPVFGGGGCAGGSCGGGFGSPIFGGFGGFGGGGCAGGRCR